MASKKFYIIIIIRVLLLGLTCILFSFIITKKEQVFTIFALLFAFILQIILLIRYINRTNNDLVNFFTAIKNSDSTLKFSIAEKSLSFSKLNQLFDDISKQFQKIRLENEAQNQLLQNIVDHVGIGLLTFDDSGKVELINNAAINLLQIAPMKNIKVIDVSYPELCNTIKNLAIGQQKLMKIKVQDEFMQLSVKTSEFKLHDKLIRLVSLQNIKRELEENELDSWQKLIRVLTHEIMNSIAPITSLATSLRRFFRRNDSNLPVSTEMLSQSVLQKTLDGLNIIEERGEGLVNFVTKYRSLMPKSKLKIETIKIAELFYNLEFLLQNEIKKKNIDFVLKIYPFTLHIDSDQKLIEQILINLINNAMDALENKENKQIVLNAFKNDSGRKTIQVEDNGIGIPEEIMERIFIPFFTTKEKGNGIGLSLSRQIMRMHGGTISASSKTEKGTIFSLEF
jgi:signal transduction histidine kinase